MPVTIANFKTEDVGSQEIREFERKKNQNLKTQLVPSIPAEN